MKRKKFLNIVGKGGLAVVVGSSVLASGCQKENLLTEPVSEASSSVNGTAETRQGFVGLIPESGYHDFGDVVVGQEATTIITIYNIEDHTTILWEVVVSDSSGTFQLRTPVYPPIELAPIGMSGDSIDVEIAFVPPVDAYFETVIWADTLDMRGYVDLYGMGVTDVPPIPSNPRELNTYYLSEVNGGNIIVDNQVFTNHMVLAVQFYTDGKTKEACKKLEWLGQRCDGEFPPPDMISGSAETMSKFRSYLEGVMARLDC